jgi:hypothetical protein
MSRVPAQRPVVNRSDERGSLLGIVIVLLTMIAATGGYALWTLRGDISASYNERLSQQLFECAEQALNIGRQYFSNSLVRQSWDTYLQTDVCSQDLPCPPFAQVKNGTPPGDGYPSSAPFKGRLAIGTGSAVTLDYQIGIYNNPGDPGNTSNPIHNTDSQIVIYSRCRDPLTQQWRAVEALVQVPLQFNGDYSGQIGRGMRNHNNSNY